MWFVHHGRPYVLEAKNCWMRLDGDAVSRPLTKGLQAARSDANATYAYNGEAKLACLFVVPSIHHDSSCPPDRTGKKV
jgi:hypothetical protein